MAKGRFISKEICLDKKVNSLSDGYSMVGFTWLITHADCEGRIYGDPAIVKSLIFPRLLNITVEMVAGYIQEWEDAGLIKTYEVNDDKYIEFPNFGKHQVGLRKERESPSTIPSNCGFLPAKIRKNRVNVKLIEVNNNIKSMSDVRVGILDIHQTIMDYFINDCKFQKPKIPSGTYDIAWVEPITEMMKLTDNDFDTCVRLINASITQADKSKLSITAPKSLINIFRSEVAREARREKNNTSKEFRAEEFLQR